MERIPHCCHWGAFTALVEDGRIVGIEPHPGDPAPSHMLHAIPDLMDPKVRVDRPYVREGWLNSRNRTGRGSDRMIAVPWDHALDLVASEIDRVRKTYSNDAIFAGRTG